MEAYVPYSWGWCTDRVVCASIQDWLKSRVVGELPPNLTVATFAYIDIQYAATTKIVISEYTWPDIIPIGEVYGEALCADYPNDLEFFAYGEYLLSMLEDTAADLLLINKPGLAHPRYFGPATHLGLLVNKPTIGVTADLGYTVEGDSIVVPTYEFLVEDIVLETAKRLEVEVPVSSRVYGGVVGKVIGSKYYATVGDLVDVQVAAAVVTKIMEGLGGLQVHNSRDAGG
jgi:deoxyinosine 3'endonuclease (endonuclease V)